MKSTFSFGVPALASSFVFSLFTFSSCNPSPSDILPADKRVNNYYQSTLAQDNKFNDGFDAYFDFSDGMSEAYKNPDTRDNLKGITQKITGDKDWRIFGLADNKISDLSGLTQTNLYNKITAPRFVGIMAPIEKALSSIVSNNKRALLVTDFEEYTSDKRIQFQNYAKSYFIEWLRKGGQINFYVTDYKEFGQPKHLYFAVFDDAEGSTTSIINKALEGRPVNYKRFSLNNSPVKVSNNYGVATKGGNYHDAAGLDVVTCVNESDPSNDIYKRWPKAEFYPCGETWSNIKKNASAMSELPGNDRYYALLRGVILDASNNDSYNVDDYSIVVTNVQNDYSLFSDYSAALRNPADVKTNSDGTKTVSFDSHPDAQFYYDPVSGEIMKEFTYQKQSCPNIPDMFVLAEAVMKQSQEKDPNKTELAIDFSPNFSGVSNLVNSEDLLRIDVIVSKASIQYDQLKDLFEWGNPNNRNGNLLEAVRNTLQAPEVNPEGKPVYTYFIKAY